MSQDRCVTYTKHVLFILEFTINGMMAHGKRV